MDSGNSLANIRASHALRANNFLVRLQEEDRDGLIGEILEASPITLQPQLKDREFAFCHATYNDNMLLRKYHRCGHMPRCANIYHRRVLETLFFMSQYFYTFSFQKRIRNVMPDVFYDRYNICDPHAIVQSPSRCANSRAMPPPPLGGEFITWLIACSPSSQVCPTSICYSCRCHEPTTTPRLHLLPLPDVSTRLPSH